MITAHLELKEESEELTKLKEKMGDPVALHRRLLEVVDEKEFEIHPFVRFGKFYIRDGKQVFYEDMSREMPSSKKEKFSVNEVKVKT